MLSQVNLLIVIFGVCFFAGGVANIAHLDDTKRCSSSSRRLCRDLDRLADCQIACFVSYDAATVRVYIFRDT